MQRSLVLFAIVAVVALSVVTWMPASQQASAHHKAHTAPSKVSTTVVVHHKAHTASKGKISVHPIPKNREVDFEMDDWLNNQISKHQFY